MLRWGKFWLAAYVVFLGAAVTLTLKARNSALAELGSAESQQQWNDWRAAAKEQSQAGPVRRSVPKSAEPPGLVLMRDHFAVVMTAAVVFGTLLFITFMIAVRGVLAKRPEASIRIGSGPKL